MAPTKKKNKKGKSMNKTKKKIKKKTPALLPAIKNFALIIPEKGSESCIIFLLKFFYKILEARR